MAGVHETTAGCLSGGSNHNVLQRFRHAVERLPGRRVLRLHGYDLHVRMIHDDHRVSAACNSIGRWPLRRKEARRFNAADFSPAVTDWLENGRQSDCARFDLLLGDAPVFHGVAPGTGDCLSKVAEWGVHGPPLMLAWIERMRNLPAIREPGRFFPV